MNTIEGVLSMTVLFQAATIALQNRGINVSFAGGGYLLDTNVIMDGRIGALYETGVMQGKIYVHAAVLQELQQLADGRDALKRERARSGLTHCEQLKKTAGLRFKVVKSPLLDGKTDDSLLAFAKKNKACVIVTNDVSLAELARIQNISVVTMQSLEAVMRPLFRPGEALKLEVVRMGETARQGVGYRPDGLMIVADGCRKSDIGKTINITAEHYASSKTGRILFARKIG